MSILDVKAIHAWLMVDSLVVIEQVPLTPFASSPYIAITNVPNLRFPEFSGEWEMSSIGEQFELYSGNTPSRMNKNQFDGSINWITSGELKEHYISDTKEKISEEAAKNNSLKLLPVGTLHLSLLLLFAIIILFF